MTDFICGMCGAVVDQGWQGQHTSFHVGLGQGVPPYICRPAPQVYVNNTFTQAQYRTLQGVQVDDTPDHFEDTKAVEEYLAS